MTKVLFAGESWSVTSTHTKGFDSFVTSEYAEGGAALLNALDTDGFDVTYMPCHVAASAFPSTLEDLNNFDVVLLSDIGSNTFLLPSATFIGGKRSPNRLDLLRDWTLRGGGFGMIGGYMSFQGIEGKANYRNTALADILPVQMLDGDDRIEAPQGVSPVLNSGTSPIVSGIEGSWPALLGYQRFVAKPHAVTVASFENDPLLVVGEQGEGRSLAYASDIGPHWAPDEFTSWAGFGQLWRESVKWLHNA